MKIKHIGGELCVKNIPITFVCFLLICQNAGNGYACSSEVNTP